MHAMLVEQAAHPRCADIARCDVVTVSVASLFDASFASYALLFPIYSDCLQR